ncbi:MAG: WD40 repeat-like protein [Chaenotheca gracillima]|nr:MAG: WD40 repeat-like protein [Chaenotheca gracillima]
MSISGEGIWAPLPTTTRGQPTPLSCDSKGERIAYASNKSIFLRSIDNPSISTQYTGHTVQTTVARFAPSGYYVASGDVSGSVRVWDCVGEGATKGEYHIVSGRINDIAWDGDSQRVIAVGDGKERFGHCITADSGNSVGEISGHSSLINSVAIRQQRPLRAATVSNDSSLVFYHGAPFKFNTSLRGQHNNFVYGTAFSPDGSTLVSVGADRKIWLYDGKTGEAKGQVGEGEHKGSIFGVSWAKDSKRFVTASGDQTVKIWDVEAGKVAQSWRMGEEGVVSIPDHQVGVVWPGGSKDGLVISLSLSGNLNYLSEGTPQPTQSVYGHQRNITTVDKSPAIGTDKGETLWTGSYEGRVCSWDISTGIAGRVDGETHSGQVTGFAAGSDGQGRTYSAGWDDTLRSIDQTAQTFTGTATSLGGQPKGIARLDAQRVAVATTTAVEIYNDGVDKVSEILTKFAPTSIAATVDSSGTAHIAVGGDDHILRIYTLPQGSKTLEPKTELTNATAPISCVAYSHDGTRLAAGTSSGKIIVYDTSSFNVVTDRWSSHNGRVMSIAWNAEGTYAASGGLDTNVFVWSVASPGKRIKAANAHKDGVNGVVWTDGGKKVVSVGADAAVKVWKVDGL